MGMKMAMIGGVAPIFQDILNYFMTERANRRQEQRADYALDEYLSDEQKYQTPEFSDIYADYDWSGLRGGVEDYIKSGKVDAQDLSRSVGEYFSEADTDAFEKAGLADVAAASDARSRARTEGAVGTSMARGRGLDEIGDMLDAMNYQENVSRGGQALGISAQAEQMRNQTRLARAGAQAQARMAGENINAELTGMGANLFGNIGMAEADTGLRAALGESATNTDNANRAFNLDTTRAGIYTGVPYALFQGSGFNQGAQNLLQWQAINKPPKSSTGFSLGVKGYEGGFQSGCVDGDSTVFTPLGGKPLEFVSPADMVMGADGNYHKVIAKEYGFVSEHERVPHLRIWCGRSQVTITEDHPIQGKAAKDWRVGDMIEVNGEPLRITAIERASYHVSGDLCLEGNVPYIANGFAIDSVLGKDLDAYRKLIKHKNSHDRLDGGYLHDDTNFLGGWVKAS